MSLPITRAAKVLNFERPNSASSARSAPDLSMGSNQSDKDAIGPVDLETWVAGAYPILSGSPKRPSLAALSRSSGIIDLTEQEEAETAQAINNDHRFDGLTDAITYVDLLEDEFEVINLIEPDPRIVVRLGNVSCGIGKTVELSDTSFIRIESMSKILPTDQGESLVLTGQIFLRQKHLGPKVPNKLNELIWVGNSRQTVYADNLVRNRKLTMTNRPYAELCIHNCPEGRLKNAADDGNAGPLFCRWKRTRQFEQKRVVAENWCLLSEAEADADARISEDHKRSLWRQRDTVRGGSHLAACTAFGDDGQFSDETFRQYSFGDAFCGAGGTSCGARMAGLNVAWSFDYDALAIRSYRQNFPASRSLVLAVDQFINLPEHEVDAYRVDILHISPPCQPFSPAHTVPSQVNDEKNQAALLCVGLLVQKVKPRIVTIEETEGIVSRHKEWFAALINLFIDVGYSVAWKIIKCGDYGIPQLNRKRLVLIAAGPGENLPQFPMPTHARIPTATLKKIPTIGDLISDLEGSEDHDTTKRCQPCRRSFSPDSYAHTLTCNSGVGNYHPSGLRNYTVRELACLQTFPRSFRFAGVPVTSQRRQIGNAVPPKFARTLMKAIIESLRQSDGVVDY